ncbi:MAG: sigma-E factor negative regulatory protein RseB [Cryptosporangiaceae bacterium]|nr:sigma-E factor negative regulatory protein RseB [Cryptosporangiaceae bacterium]
MTPPLIGQQPLLRACQRFVLVLGAGALGAAICATVILVAAGGERAAIRPARADSPPVPPGRPLGAAESAAVALLRNASAAAAALHYTGRKLFASWASSGTSSVLANVDHVPGRGTWVTVTSAGAKNGESPSAPPGQAPGAEGQLAEDGGGAPDPAALDMLAGEYMVRIAATEPCAGRLATLVEVAHPGWSGPAGRFWIDEQTGILLRHELFDREGHQVRVVAFLDLDIVDEPAGSPVLHRSGGTVVASLPSGAPSPRPADPVRSSQVGALRRSGWVVPASLPGGFGLYRVREVTASGSRALQLTYSDGLFTASVFAQRGRLDTAHLPGFAPATVAGTPVYERAGLYRQLVWPGGDTVYTLVTDAPDASAEQLVAALPYGPQQGGLLSRVGKGIDRVGSWINPFE